MQSSLFPQFGSNSGYIEELYQLYLSDPALVGPEWASFFSRLDSTPEAHKGTNGVRAAATNGHAYVAAAEVGSSLSAQQKASALIEAYRLRGHLSAESNPLKDGIFALPGAPELEPSYHEVTAEELSASVLWNGVKNRAKGTLQELLSALKEIYCGTIGWDFAHVEDAHERAWLIERIEKSGRPAFSLERKRRFLEKLHQAEYLEAELHRRYVGAKRFSLQGGDALLPMLDHLLEKGAEQGVSEVVFGMAHRGRLNVLVNVCGKPLAELFSEFEDTSLASIVGAGDVKYHQGWTSSVELASGGRMNVALAPNPSHLEFVNPVVEGIVRAKQDMMKDDLRRAVLAVLIHGDAAFAGQGVVAETLGFSATPAYSTGGTVHIIINNQVGFTTHAAEGRSSTYSSDMAKGIGAPVFHVNADDVEGAAWATELALEYRNQFQRDVVIDLLCYRKYGHNEGDDPTFTQPVMYTALKGAKAPFERYAESLVTSGDLTAESVSEVYRSYTEKFQAAVAVRSEARYGEACAVHGKLQSYPSETGVGIETIEAVARALVDFPEGFTPHAKLKNILEKRSQTALDGGHIEWGLGEALAYGSLLTEGISVRLSGQDSGRGTFSHRHLELHDFTKNERFYPLRRFAADRGLDASFEVYNSTLSETGVMGFEFGYSATRDRTLVLWEAQFGDFANGAQVIIDQFIAASESKWGQNSNLVLLLPHGYEGQGPEHSSARLERFLQLSAEGNMTVAYPTNAAQYFHLLRRHAHAAVKRPLVVMTPKSLLRAHEATSKITEFTEGRFQEALLTDVGGKSSAVIFTTGKVYYELVAALQEAKANAKVIRLEQIYPFPKETVMGLLKGVKPAQVVWVQEEPQNMGAWMSTQAPIEELFGKRPLYAGRPASASTACGSSKRHALEQKALLKAAIEAVSRAK